MVAAGYGLDDKLSTSGGTMTGTLTLAGSPPLNVPAGAAAGLVGTSDADGNFSWGDSVPGSLVGLAPTGVAATDTASIQGLMNLAGTALLQAGTFALDATLSAGAAGIRVCGQGPGATILAPQSDYGDVFSFAAAADDCIVEQLSIVFHGTTDTSGSTSSTHAAFGFTIAATSGQETSHVVLRDLHITGMGQAIVAPWTSGTSLNYAQYYDLAIQRIRIRSCNAGLLMLGFSDSRIADIDCQNIFGQDMASLQPHVAPVSSGASVSSTYSATAQNLINDLGNSVIDRIAVYGGVGDGIVFQDCVTSDVRDCVTGSLTGNGTTILGCQAQFRVRSLNASLNSLAGVYITTDAVATQDLVFDGCLISNNQKQGINATPTGGTTIGRVRLKACDVINNSQASSGTYDGMLFQGQDLEIFGGSYSDYQGSPTQKSGVNANTSGSDYIALIAADVTGNVTNTVTASGTHVIGWGCRGLNFTGFSTFTPGVPNTGSGNAVGNGNAYPVTIYLAGQSGTHIIDVNSTDQALPADPPLLTLQPNEKIYFATTKPSSWAWYGN